jgi:DNA-binding MarR family transcriptional regulator
MKNMRATSAAPVAVPFSHETWLLQRLGQAADRGEPCPPVEALAAERGLSRAAIARLFDHLEERGAITFAVEGKRRVVTIIATGAQTAAASGLHEVACQFCGGLFRPRDRRNTYCTKTCGQKAWHEQHKPAQASDDEPDSEFPPHSPQGRNESGVRPAPTIFEVPAHWRAYRYEDHPEAKRRYDERKARGYQPKIYPHHSNVSRGDSPLGDFFL